jgi:hypothetical protein
MRIAPALVATTGTNFYRFERNTATDDFNSFTISRPTTNAAVLFNSTEISGTAGQSGFVYITTSAASIAFNSEL